MSRPRIRTLKPETWHDERIGTLSREARLLFVGLITMADDEGRLRAMPSAITGHVFPYDDDAPRKLPAWLTELADKGVVMHYRVGEVPYVAFPNWTKHQRVDKPNDSVIPPPPNTNGARA